MSWENEVKEIRKREKLIQEMGGKEKIKSNRIDILTLSPNQKKRI